MPTNQNLNFHCWELVIFLCSSILAVNSGRRGSFLTKIVLTSPLQFVHCRNDRIGIDCGFSEYGPRISSIGTIEELLRNAVPGLRLRLNQWLWGQSPAIYMWTQPSEESGWYSRVTTLGKDHLPDDWTATWLSDSIRNTLASIKYALRDT